MRGIVYGVGVGPGDPELMTLKAVRLIRESGVIAVPGENAADTAAYRIAAAAVPELAEKRLLGIPMPMSRDREAMEAAHRRGAALLEEYLGRGENVVFLTLGDPTVYSTFSYLQHILERDGCRVELISGVPSFCAAAARLNRPLAEWDELLHILPAAHRAEELSGLSGSCVLMKSARSMPRVKELLRCSGRDVCAVENCGMDGERIWRSVDEIPDDAGYFTLILAREPEKKEPRRT